MAEMSCVCAVTEAHARACSHKMAGVERAGRCLFPGDERHAGIRHTVRRGLEDETRARGPSASLALSHAFRLRFRAPTTRAVLGLRKRRVLRALSEHCGHDACRTSPHDSHTVDVRSRCGTASQPSKTESRLVGIPAAARRRTYAMSLPSVV